MSLAAQFKRLKAELLLTEICLGGTVLQSTNTLARTVQKANTFPFGVPRQASQSIKMLKAAVGYPVGQIAA